MSQLLDVSPIVLTVELLEDRYESIDIVRAVYRELHSIVFAHDAAEGRIVAQVLEHAQGEHGEETRHAFEAKCDGVNFIHRIDESHCLTTNS